MKKRFPGGGPSKKKNAPSPKKIHPQRPLKRMAGSPFEDGWPAFRRDRRIAAGEVFCCTIPRCRAAAPQRGKEPDNLEEAHLMSQNAQVANIAESWKREPRWEGI